MNKIINKFAIILVIIGLIGTGIVITSSLPYFIHIIDNYNKSVDINYSEPR